MLKLDPPTVLRLQRWEPVKECYLLLGVRMNTESPRTYDSDTLGMPTVQENHLGGCCISVLEMEA